MEMYACPSAHAGESPNLEYSNYRLESSISISISGNTCISPRKQYYTCSEHTITINQYDLMNDDR